MNKAEFSNIMAAINIVFPRTIETKEQVAIWHDNLSDLEYMPCQQAVKKVIQESEYPPKIATIRKAYKDITRGLSLTSTEAIEIVNNAISKFGRYRLPEAMSWIKSQDENTYTVIKAIGFATYCGSNPNYSDKLFTKMYDEYVQHKDSVDCLERNFALKIRAIKENTIKMLGDSE